MAIVTLSGNVDTLASGKKWSIEIDFNEQQPNLIQEENDTAFTTTSGNWYYQMDTSWASGGYLFVEQNATPGNYMELRTNSVNRLVYPMEKGKRYKISMRIKSSSEPIDVRIGLFGLYHHQYGFGVLGDGEWVTLEKEFLYNDPTDFRNPVVFFDTFWDQNNEVYIDWIKLELLDVVPISNSPFAVVEFGAWSVGTEDLKPAFVDGIKTSLVIRPLGGNMTTGFRSTLVDWLTTFNRNIGRVRFYDVSEPEDPILVWRGKIDQKSVSIDLMDNTLSFDVVDFVIANSDIPSNTNPFEWDINNLGAPLNAYRTIEELVSDYCNYMSPWIMADTFYHTITSDSTIRGKDLLNRLANIQGYNNSGTVVKFGIYGYRYFSDHYESPYGSTLGELLNDLAYAFQVKIIPWLNGTVRMDSVYDTGGSATAIADSVITAVEQGIVDMEQRGVKIDIVGTRTTMVPTPYSNFNLSAYVPSQSACLDGAGNLRKFVESSNLMLLNDRADAGDANSLVADLVSQNTSGTLTQSYFVNNTTYVTPTRFQASYYDNGVETVIPWSTWLELHKALVYLGFLKQRKYLKLSLTGTNFSPASIFTVSWDTDRYKVQSLTIDWVNNETELYLISM